ncbi:MAG: hypothetical protein R3E01_20090 [Pirellulaceae bacterium]|nr:hypothetical protein [Planctomycetales bacterium]
MKILEKEIGLREETRTAEQAKPAWDEVDYLDKANGLSETQETLARRTGEVVKSIRELPDGEANFAKEIGLLTVVEQVMDETTGILSRPDTGPEAIAAETEAIELLLQTKRVNPNSGGGGGSNPGGGGTGDTTDVALALLGIGDEKMAQKVDRATEQTTGVTGSNWPAEFRAGLDAYFGAIEQATQ